jgi:hypothetical protein
MDIFVITLTALFIKHYIVDYTLQTQDELKFKGVYGDGRGITHSLKHGAFTTLYMLGVNPMYALYAGVFDAIAHYHIDWFKVRYGAKSQSDPKYWKHFGLDQLAHQCCYLVIAVALVSAR